MHAIKVNRALGMCQFLPKAQAEILSSLPPTLVEALTARQLAEVMQSLNRHWHKAAAWKEKEILAEGAIWDGRAEKLREIAA